ncbi:UPF0481 protein At3g47200-like [Lolium rigidum]|uniref:UPF0481 protein At3g47200-like n=1 Tax=Lolium rigidum TaxID=89674 RepID=UPI001F5DEC78|nr:UPF0481 protein At3g47200-like [Lolium rigidum]
MATEEYDSSCDVDIDELVISMKSDLNRCMTLVEDREKGNRCCLICKVVHRIRQTDSTAYEPSVLSVGPYHHSELSLQAMETEKWICLDYILKLNREVSLREYLSFISVLEKETRGYYTEEINMDSREFLQMLLLDSCFILVYLGGIHSQGANVDGEQLNENTIYVRKREAKDMSHMDAVSCQSVSGHLALDIELNKMGKDTDSHNQENYSGTIEWYNSSAVYDLLLLENQIPFFIVKKIYRFFSRHVDTTSLLTGKISEFMEGILYHFPKVITEANRPEDFYHLLHLCHKYLKPSHGLEDDHHLYAIKPHYFHFIFDISRKIFSFGRGQDMVHQQTMFHELDWSNSVQKINRWRRAVDYHEAGMMFKKREFDEDNPHSLLDIRFTKGLMEIPCLPIDDKSSLLFRNLIAFEQTCPQVGDDITAYFMLMSQLTSTASDVALLAQKGIIVHQMESDEDVSTLFTKLFEYVAFNFHGEHYLKSLCCAMEAHYQNRINRWMAWLWHNHFSNPWVGFAAVASAFVVLCSIMQTVLAFLSYRG